MPRTPLTRALGRPLMAMGLGALGLLGSACDRDEHHEDPAAMAERVADLLPIVVPEDSPVPATREDFLRELAPLPLDSLLVVYEVEGPGGLRGTLEVLARPGGFRRENWTIEVPLGNESPRRLDGSTIQTPDGVWVEGQPPEAWTPSPLGALADAYVALDEPTRGAVIGSLRELATSLETARAEAGHPSSTVLDVPCHVTRVSNIEMCLWEATGLPLRYTSEGLTVQAINIDPNAPIGAHAFDVPFAAPHGPDIDAAAMVRMMASGDLSEVAPLLHAGLRLPSAA